MPKSKAKAAYSVQPRAQPAVLVDNLTEQEKKRHQVCLFLRGRINWSGQRLDNTAVQDAAEAFGLKPRGVAGMWWKYKEAILFPETTPLDVRRKRGSGRKSAYTFAEVHAKVQAAPLHLRQSLRTLAAEIGISHTTLHRFIKQGVVDITAVDCRPDGQGQGTEEIEERPACIEKPKRPLNAYNLFFILECEYLSQNAAGYKDDDDSEKVCISNVPDRYKSTKLMADWYVRPGKRTKRKHRKSKSSNGNGNDNGKIGFTALSGLVSNGWMTIDTNDPETKEYVTRIAARELAEYNLEMKQYNELNPPPPPKIYNQKKCAKCGMKNNKTTSRHCPKCVAARQKKCSQCGLENKITSSRYCTKCVAARRKVSEKPPGTIFHSKKALPTAAGRKQKRCAELELELQTLRSELCVECADKKQNAQNSLPTGQRGKTNGWLWV